MMCSPIPNKYDDQDKVPEIGGCTSSTTGCNKILEVIEDKFPLKPKYLKPNLSDKVWKSVDFSKL
jgi:hypothetical protein